MAEKMYWPFNNVNMKIRRGKQVMNAKEGILVTIPVIRYTVAKAGNASVAVSAEDVFKAVHAKGNDDVKIEEVQKALDRQVTLGNMTTSRSDFVAKTQGASAASESHKVETLSAQVAELKADKDTQGKTIAEQAAEIAQLKEKLGKKK